MCPNRAGGSPILGKGSAAAAAGAFAVPTAEGAFAVPTAEGAFAVPTAEGAFAVPTAEGKKGRHLRFLPSLNTRFPCNHSLGADGRLRKREKRERQRIFTTAWYNTFPHFGCRTATSNLGLRRRGITVPRNSSARYDGQGLRG